MATLSSRTPSVDTFLASDLPTTKQDATIWLSVRNYGNGTSTQRHTIIKFDLSSLLGATINSATITFNNQSSFTVIGNYIACHRLTTSPTNDATWNTYDGSNAWTSAGGDYYATPTQTLEITPANDSAGEDCVFNVTTDVQAIANGTYTNCGWLLRYTGNASENEDGKWDPQSDGTEGDRPLLTVDYTPAATSKAVLTSHYLKMRNN